MSKRKPTTYHSCIIVRTFERKHGHFNLNDPEEPIVYDRTETVTGPCNVPLFSDEERASGICKSCRKGWETEGNVFASETERQRATAKH
jgi:hypothetical protein